MPQGVLTRLKEGYREYRAGRLGVAEALYRQVLAEEQDNVHALNLLGVLYVNSSRPREAVAAITRAIAMHPDDAQSHANLGLAYKELAGFAQAEEHLRRSIALDGSNPVVHNNLGNVLREMRRRDDAVACYQRALELNPRYAECWCNFAQVWNDLQQFTRAHAAVRRALALEPGLPQAWSVLAEAFRGQSRFDEAIENFHKALVLEPANGEALLNLATTYREYERPEEARATLERLLALEPGNPKAFNALGILQEQLGQPEQAAESFRRAIDIAPRVAYPHYQLAQIKGRRSTDEEFQAMEELLRHPGLHEDDQLYLNFGLASAYEQRQRFDEAFTAWAHGNAIKARRSPYDAQQQSGFQHALVRACDEALQRLAGEGGIDDPRPVFIVGMPRSGTTLTDQILASHSQVRSVGEVSFAYDMTCRVKELCGSAFPDSAAKLSGEQLGQIAGELLARLLKQSGDARIVLDKTPLNFQYVGLLAQALPRARFIHCHRDPVDNCFSVFKLPFADVQTYAHDLVALGRYYSGYRALMAAWRERFGERILDVRYEDTVADAEAQSRRMLDFLGLAFEPAVLEFHRAERLVRTPSASQVRQPIYTAAVNAWHPYRHHLAPLLAALEPD